MLPPDIKKIYDKWKTNPHGVRKEEMIKVLTSLGCSLSKGGKHQLKFIHPKLADVPGFYAARFTIALERGRIVKPIYVKRALKVIDIITEED